MKAINVVGARPNFMKIAPISRKMKKYSEIEPLLIHTGQHYDQEMSKLFFEDLNLPKPDIYLGIGSGTHAEQTAKIMIELEKIFINEQPDLVLVVGDVNSTMAAALTATKLRIPVAHIESGLRSFDRSMPEEINRVVTDAISEYLFTTCEDANDNLHKEGIPDNRIFFVGNVMIDSLIKIREKSKASPILEKLNLKVKGYVKPYGVLTLHRPSNVDRAENLYKILEAMKILGKELPIIFPIHPRTRKKISKLALENVIKPNVKMNSHINAGKEGLYGLPPIGYIDFIQLIANAKIVFTDSGGIQEETTILKIPCLTLRNNTERPITIKEGTNILVGNDKDLILKATFEQLDKDYQYLQPPKLWDGNAAERVVEILSKIELCN